MNQCKEIEAAEPEAVLAEAAKRDAELESGRVQPLTEAQF